MFCKPGPWAPGHSCTADIQYRNRQRYRHYQVGFNCDKDSSANELSVYGTVYRLLLSRLRLSAFSRRGWTIRVKMWIFKASASRPPHLQACKSVLSHDLRLSARRYPQGRSSGACSYRSELGKSAARRCCYRSTGQTDGRTDTRPLRRPRTAQYAGSVDKHA